MEQNVIEEKLLPSKWWWTAVVLLLLVGLWEIRWSYWFFPIFFYPAFLYKLGRDEQDSHNPVRRKAG